MEKIEIIVEAMNNEEQEARIAAIANVKYRLPSLKLTKNTTDKPFSIYSDYTTCPAKTQ